MTHILTFVVVVSLIFPSTQLGSQPTCPKGYYQKVWRSAIIGCVVAKVKLSCKRRQCLLNTDKSDIPRVEKYKI